MVVVVTVIVVDVTHPNQSDEVVSAAVCAAAAQESQTRGGTLMKNSTKLWPLSCHQELERKSYYM